MNAWLQPLRDRLPLQTLARVPRLAWLGAAAGLIAVIAVAFLWARGPGYAVLYSNLSDSDGGPVVAALDKMNVPYKFAQQGGALLVPADEVRRTRMLLAAQGLPKNGNVGFDLVEKPGFGASDFTERAIYQHALEGEIANTIEAINVVSHATVHLALPPQTLFVRERKQPSASILVNLRPGRTLDDGQVAAIKWLVASAVPELAADRVSIVDQYGHLLSSPDAGDGSQLDASHLSYERRVEAQVAERIQGILAPMLGAGNVHAQVSAQLDFSRIEDTSETYGPNSRPDQTAIRSKQTHDTTRVGALPAQGIPGALSNQPPATATANIVNPPQAPAGNQATAPGQTPGRGPQGPQEPQDNSQSSTVNYELDHRITHTQAPVGSIKRLSVAVVVNDQPNAKGVPEPLSTTQMAQVMELVKQAMGYSSTRGDTVNVVNTRFRAQPTVSWWQDPYWIGMARSTGLDLLGLLVLWFAWRRGLRPLLLAWGQARSQTARQGEPSVTVAAAEPAGGSSGSLKPADSYEGDLSAARGIAGKDPRAMAMVMRAWMQRKARGPDDD